MSEEVTKPVPPAVSNKKAGGAAPAQDEGKKEHELFEQRLASAQKWRELGANPFGNGFRPEHLAGELLAKLADPALDAAQAQLDKANKAKDQAAIAAAKAVLDPLVAAANEKLTAAPQACTVAGRIVALNSFGKAAFIRVQDRSGAIQVHVKKDALGDRYELFKLCDLGDFVGIGGTLFRSKTGELSLSATRFEPLTKTLRPLPGKFGTSEEAKKWLETNVGSLSDTEARYRQRYLDMLANPDVRETFKKRIKLVQFIRRFLDDRGYLEVETPMMHSLVSGAAARPFKTHHNTLDMQLFMRIAPELHLKRLVVGGFDRVYEINRNFRNEGISTRHNPEFTMLEFYEAYATYEDLMNLTEEMLSQAAQHVCGATKLKFGENTIDFAKGWRRLPMWQSVREKLGCPDDVQNDREALLQLALKNPEGKRDELSKLNRGELIGALFEQHVEHTLIQPTFVTEFPVELSPLARRNDKNPLITDRFELFANGWELANAFSELNDPIDQKGRFEAQVEAKNRGQQETMDYDADYIRALEHGLPPTAGQGIGIDRLAMLFTDSPSIRDVILFPLLKPQGK
ncbi:MAG: lysine--tRNA ligase [Archangiaceae bacterium]|nr:lysine--tRNA ligase [Archangiaceae bacterium]